MKNKKNTIGYNLNFGDNAHNMGIILDLFANEEFNADGKKYERITCLTSGLELVNITKDGVRAIIPILEGLRDQTEDKSSLNQLIDFFKLSQKDKDKTLIFVDPIRTPEAVFKRLYG